MKKVTSLFVSILCAASLSAQETTAISKDAADKGKEINNIKRSEQAVYADIMEFVAPDNDEVPTLAQQRSQQLLQTHVIEIFAKRMKMDKKDVQEIWDVIDDKCQNIVVRKGDICRVFTYIMKDALGLTPKKPKKGDVEKYLTPDKSEAEMAEVSQSEALGMSEQLANILTSGQDSIDNVTTTPVTVAQAPPVEQQVQEQVLENQAQQETVVKQTANQVQQVAVVQETIPEQAVSPLIESVPKVEPEVPTNVVAPALAKTMLNQANMTELLRFLLKEKNRQTLMYGSLANMTNQENCFIVIINKAAKKVVTVLGPGSDKRINYVTSQYDNIANYKGGNYQAIVVQEY